MAEKNCRRATSHDPLAVRRPLRRLCVDQHVFVSVGILISTGNAGKAPAACGLASPSATPPCATRYRSRSMSSLDAKVQAEIMERSNELHASFIQPLNDKVHGPLEKSNTGGYQSTKMPFVFVLGNHSSGKSSFINYVLGRNIQTAGVAPTDDRCIYPYHFDSLILVEDACLVFVRIGWKL